MPNRMVPGNKTETVKNQNGRQIQDSRQSRPIHCHIVFFSI